LVAAYHKDGKFGDYFNDSKFFHILHNADSSHEGRIYIDNKDDCCHLHHLPADFLIDKHWKEFIINPTRCAVLCSDNWGTVSRSYREEILETSSIKDILLRSKKPFAFPNGIPKAEKRAKFDKLCGSDHMKAKFYIQNKYFNYEKLNDDQVLFGFVGRITKQKGIM